MIERFNIDLVSDAENHHNQNKWEEKQEGKNKGFDPFFSSVEQTALLVHGDIMRTQMPEQQTKHGNSKELNSNKTRNKCHRI